MKDEDEDKMFQGKVRRSGGDNCKKKENKKGV